MSTAQIVFAIPFAIVSLLVVYFSIFVISTTFRGDRWVRKGK